MHVVVSAYLIEVWDTGCMEKWKDTSVKGDKDFGFDAGEYL